MIFLIWDYFFTRFKPDIFITITFEVKLLDGKIFKSNPYDRSHNISHKINEFQKFCCFQYDLKFYLVSVIRSNIEKNILVIIILSFFFFFFFLLTFSFSRNNHSETVEKSKKTKKKQNRKLADKKIIHCLFGKKKHSIIKKKTNAIGHRIKFSSSQ